MSIWCAAVVGTVDNVLRPALVGKDTQIPDLLILIGTLGGLTLFGAAGLILGPIVVALFITIWEIYGSAFRDHAARAGGQRNGSHRGGASGDLRFTHPDLQRPADPVHELAELVVVGVPEAEPGVGEIALLDRHRLPVRPPGSPSRRPRAGCASGPRRDVS